MPDNPDPDNPDPDNPDNKRNFMPSWEKAGCLILTVCFQTVFCRMGIELILQDLAALRLKMEESLFGAKTLETLESKRVEFLGKKGKLTAILKGLGALSPDERSLAGKKANELKSWYTSAEDTQKKQIKEARLASLHKDEFIDLSTPLSGFAANDLAAREGSVLPLSKLQSELEDIFTGMGFAIADGPEVETDYNNFGALNFDEDHPAREMQDTFYTKDGHLLRTHTSSVQVRALKKYGPPLRIVVPGRVYRYEEIDASHEHTFYQMEGMVIDKKVNVANLIFLMQTLLKEVFQRSVTVRLRPGYFPFVEPGFELDMQCALCEGKGCPVCKQSGWVEVLPCGLVHPNVIKSAGLDPNQWQGAAFGLGLTRLVMLRYKIEDIRLQLNPNIQFLSQFKKIGRFSAHNQGGFA